MKGMMSILFVASVASCQPRAETLVNFSHLRHLTERIALDGQQAAIVHIYADAPGYQWVDAGDEGITCVDDAARAAVVYLRAYELRRDTSCLSEARSLLRFVMFMQADDGEFYNFLLPDHSVNRTGKTSFKSFGWWAGRGVWAMATGYRVMKDVDRPFAEILGERVRRSLPHVDVLLRNYGRTRSVGTFTVPEWLMYGSGSDATTELMLGLVEFYKATGDKHVAEQIRKLADGMVLMQDGDGRTFPFGAHRSWETMWHAWGNGQTHVLASAGAAFDDSAMIHSAEREARGFYSRLLISRMLREWDLSDPLHSSAFDQIAYAIRPMAVGLLRLYDATKKEEYLRMAGIAAAWLFGNSAFKQPVYDPTSGRCCDGIRDSMTVNRNSGAESTIEALATILEIEQYPLARKYLTFRKSGSQESGDAISAVFSDDAGERLMIYLDTRTGALSVR